MTTASSIYLVPLARTMAGIGTFLTMIGLWQILGVTSTAYGADPADAIQTLQRQDERRFYIKHGDVNDPTTWSFYSGDIDPNTWESRNPYVNWPEVKRGEKPRSSDVVFVSYYGGMFEDEQTLTQEEPVPVTDEQVRLLARIPTLRVLSFGDAGLKPRQIETLASLSQLKVLNITQGGDCSLTKEHLAAVGRMKELRRLSLIFIDDGGLRQLASLSKLVSLSISGGDGLTGDGLEGLAGLKCLRSLKIDCTRITDDGMFHLASVKSLRVLELNVGGLHGSGMKYLAAVPLETLTLSGATNEGLESVAKCLSLREL